MPSGRARSAVAHALAWIGFGAGFAALASVALAAGSPGALALGSATALAGAALGLLAAPLLARASTAAGASRPVALVAAALALAVLAATATLLLLDLAPWLVLAPLLGLAAGAQLAAAIGGADDEPLLAPAVRPAPTLLAAAAGTALAAAVPLVPTLDASAVLLMAAGAQLLALGLLVSVRPDAPGRAAAAHEPPVATAAARRADGRPLAARVLALVLLAAAGAGAIAALRPALSAIGADEPQPAAPVALTLALGAILGPPLARVAERLLGDRAAAVVATLGGVAALAAPIARPGALDLVAAALLGIALAASVALAELARRAHVRSAPATPVLLALAAAAGAALAALLLGAVPVPDVVLGAAIACLVASLGGWVPERVPAAEPLS
ncbi:hypothetical protein [Agrococcus sp. TSP3-2-1]|uniref:hypothetical protein n=1 Tax=Agrococcus sp. TSP3-2-1 TaxID=2804583 RepID=UPI003CF40199